MVGRYLRFGGLVCALAVGLGADSVSAQNTSTFGNISAGGATCGPQANCAYYQLPANTPWVVVNIAGTWSGSLEIATISAPNANYSNLNTVAWTNLATETANGVWTVATSGATYLLVVAPSWASGTANVTMTLSPLISPLVNPILPGNVTATGFSCTSGPCTWTGTFGGHATLDLPLTGGALSGALTAPALTDSGLLSQPCIGTSGAGLLQAGTCPPASVVTFGAKCDGATDDTTAIQAGITSVAASFGTLTLPAGKCNISNSLTIPFTQQFRFVGQSKLGSILNMTANNKPIIVANQANTHSIEIGRMTLQWATQQTTANTQSYGIQWTNAASDASGFYRWFVHDLQISQGYIGMGIYNPSGQETVWNSLFENVFVAKSAQNCVALVPASPIGMPVNTFINLSCNNTGGGPVPAGPAIYLLSAESVFIGLGIEGWTNEVIWATGGGFVHVNGLHVEHESLSPTRRIIYVANGALTCDPCGFSMDGTTTVTGAVVVQGDAGSQVTLRNASFNGTLSGAMYWIYSAVANGVTLGNLSDPGSQLTPMVGVIPQSVIASWPDGPSYYANLRQNQTTPQLVQVGAGSLPSNAGYYLDLPNTPTGVGRVWFTWSGVTNLWHVAWQWMNNDQIWHFQKCADATGTSAGPPVTTPASCFDELTMDGAGNVIAGTGYKIGPTTVIPGGTTGSTGTGNVVLSNTPTLINPVLGTPTATTIAIGGGTALATSNQTGTGSLVLSTSPTLVTPALGAATGTSLVLGGGANLVYRCTVAGTLPIGAITVNAANCGTAVATALTVN